MAANSTSTRKGKPGSRVAFIMAIIGGTAGLCLVLFLFVFVFGNVNGVELCAENLERRSFYFWEIPIVGIQVRGTVYTDISGDLQKHLATANLVPSPAANKKTWHVIQVNRGVIGSRKGDPEILVRYLEARDSNAELAWLEWTKANPQLAPAVWKGVCDLARAGKYTSIPDVLELATAAGDAAKKAIEIGDVVKQSTQAGP